jgi:ATP-binding cassette subfamily B protein
MDVQQVRQQGVGHLLGRVIESQALESLALSGGLAVGVALLELAIAAWILAQGAAAGLHLLLLPAWLLVTAALAWRQGRRLRDWTTARLDLTHELIERMVGHRTRLAQERPAQRDAHEDQAMQAYLGSAQAMDGAAAPVFVGVPAGWLWLGIAALAPAFVEGAAPAQLAISLGGILFAQRAFAGIAGGLAGLMRAGIAWRQVAALFFAGRAEPAPAFVPARPSDSTPLIEASSLSFRHRPEGEPVLAHADLSIRHGERILLEGRSGAGKSTLAALLTGLRQPQSGLLLLDGWDRHTLGDDWHRLATSAPQFHENHVLSGTLAFNLLMGREWPPSLAALSEAETLCHELGLGDLLARMPSGLMQRVGETGWQLSHGERSRIFLARALLQRAPLTVMDESFAALDPETLATCLRCTLARTDALVVIAHP